MTEPIAYNECAKLKWTTKKWLNYGRILQRCMREAFFQYLANRQLFQFFLCGHPTPRCWSSQKRELSLCVGLFRSRLRTLGTHYHPTLDPAVLWTPSNDTSRPIFSDSLNLTPSALLYLRTLWRYTNAVIIIINHVAWLIVWSYPHSIWS